jgi:hypothetical protein
MDVLYILKKVIIGLVLFYLFIFFGMGTIVLSEHADTIWISIIFGVLTCLTLFYGFYFYRRKRKDKSASEYSRYIPSEVKQQVWQRDKGKCVLCGSKRHLEFDHELPVSKGGSNTVNNIRILCKDCNRKKSGKIE